MKSRLICSVSSIALLGAIYTTSPAMATDWSGFYVGATIGYGEAGLAGCALDCAGTFNPFETINLGQLNPAGLTGGVHVGFNHQIEDIFPGGQDLVLGIEGDAMFMNWDDRIAGPDNPPGSSSGSDPGTDDFAIGNVDLLMSIRARLGMLTASDTLFYATGGVAAATGGAGASFGREVDREVEFTDIGGVIGAGVEMPIHDRVNFRIEGLYYMFDGSNEFEFSGSRRSGSGPEPEAAGMDDVFVLRAGISIPF